MIVTNIFQDLTEKSTTQVSEMSYL